MVNEYIHIFVRSLAVILIIVLTLMGTAMGEISGLVAEWHFDGDAIDSSGNGNDGKIYGATFVDGKFGKALSFDGINNYVSVADASSLKPTQITVAAWINPNSFMQWGTVLTKSSYSSWDDGYGLVHYLGSNDINFFVNNYNSTKASIDIPISQWSYVVGTYDGSNIKLYVNGLLGSSFAYLGSISNSNQPLLLGMGTGGVNNYLWKGCIDEVRIYNRALSADEVKVIYEQGQINITASPSGAEVLINGQSKGTESPTFTVSGISPGTYAVKCRLTGYSDYDTNVVLTASSVASINCALKPASTPTPTPISVSSIPPITTGSISISSAPSGAKIYIDSVYKGNTPKTIDYVSAGDHLIELKLNDFKNWMETITVEAGRTTPVAALLTPGASIGFSPGPSQTSSPSPTITSSASMPTPTSFQTPAVTPTQKPSETPVTIITLSEVQLYSIIIFFLVLAILASIYIIRRNRKIESDEDLEKIEEWKEQGYDVSELDRSLKGKK